MLAQYEYRTYFGNEKIWIGTYRNLSNLPHWHYDGELICVLKGEAIVRIEGEKTVLTEGGACFVPPSSLHSIEGSEGSLIRVALFDSSLCRDFFKWYNLCSYRLSEASGLGDELLKIKKELGAKERFYVERTDAEFTGLLYRIFQKEKIREKEKDETKETERYRKLLAKMEEETATTDFSSAAEFLSFSKPYFSEYFKKMSGMKFSAYLNALKVKKAVGLLQERSESMEQIAYDCGFGTVRNFNRVFKNATGYAPKSLPKDYVYGTGRSYVESKGFDPTKERSVLVED